MAKPKGGSTKPSAHVAHRSKKRRLKKFGKLDNNVDASDNGESSEGESDSEESSRDTSRDENDPLSLPICARLSCMT
ncbi:hypothetical protein H5410_003611 [Solanum commersonii]|uniref:Uncharacterized protein n=1 Tax=Solanum commersonii TaxID=4109 RepID=A0A9J6B568_SOLCO|nr:hypothetical protein H5410_003611 [Solanum commersonii]